MAHRECTVCSHDQREQIDNALKTGTASIRVLAGRFGLTKSSIQRHAQHGAVSKTRVNVDQLARIDAEIAKLNKAQNRAKKKRDTATALGIAKELRNWFTLRVKAEAVQALNSQKNEPTPMGKDEALQISMVLIDAELSGGTRSELFQWLLELSDRVRHYYTDHPESATKADEA